MRTALLIAVHIGGEITELLRGRETPLDEQRAEFKRLRLAGDNHDKWEALELWQSDGGIIAKHRFKLSPVSAVAPSKPATPATTVPAPSSVPEVTAPPPGAAAEPSQAPVDDAGVEGDAGPEADGDPAPVEGEVPPPDDDTDDVAPSKPAKGRRGRR
jgi:hypothetical protein